MSTAIYRPRDVRRTVALRRLGVAELLSVLASLLAFCASLAGLLADHLYRDNSWVSAAQQGNDVVTLFVAAALVVSLAFAERGSLRARLVWLGTIAYMLYNFCFYLFGLAFNDAFLAYAAIVASSLYAIVLGLRRIEVDELPTRFSSATPVHLVGGYVILLAVGLGGAWVTQCLAFVINGTLPKVLVDSGSRTSIVFALDLTLVVPAMALGGVLLWRRRPWGFLLGSILMVKNLAYAAALVAMSASQARHDVANAWSFAPFSAVILIGGLGGTYLLLRNVRGPVSGASRRTSRREANLTLRRL